MLENYGRRPTTFDFAISGKRPSSRISRIIVVPHLNGLGEITTIRFENGIFVQFSNAGKGASVTMSWIKIVADRRTIVFNVKNMNPFDWKPNLVVTRGERPINHPLANLPANFLTHVLAEANNGQVVAP